MQAGCILAQYILIPKAVKSKRLFFLDALISIASLTYLKCKSTYISMQEEKACDLSSPDPDVLQAGVDYLKKSKLENHFIKEKHALIEKDPFYNKLPKDLAWYLVTGDHHPHHDTRVEYLQKRIDELKQDPNHQHKQLLIDELFEQTQNNQ